VISFSDHQMDMIRDASRPLDAFVRSAFINAIGQYFFDKAEVGDGELARCLRELQHEYINPPRHGTRNR
jgi:hypothetical protein